MPLSLLLALWFLWKDLQNLLWITNLCLTDLAGTMSGGIQKQWRLHRPWEVCMSTDALYQASLLCREQWCLRVEIPALGGGGLPLVRIPLAITRSKDLVRGSPYLTKPKSACGPVAPGSTWWDSLLDIFDAGLPKGWSREFCWIHLLSPLTGTMHALDWWMLYSRHSSVCPRD